MQEAQCRGLAETGHGMGEPSASQSPKLWEVPNPTLWLGLHKETNTWISFGTHS